MKPQKIETVEQYLKRGGIITKFSPSPNGIAAGAGMYEKENPQEPQIIKTVSWRELYEESDPELDDPKYWKKLNERLDEMIESKGIKKLDIWVLLWDNTKYCLINPPMEIRNEPKWND